jgi:hypothetical protein
MNEPLPHLSPDQAALVAAATRYRVLLVAALSMITEASSEEAIDKALKRLVRGGWLNQIRLPDRKGCYTLSRHAVVTLGLSKKGLKAMGRAAVVANLGMICFCARRKVERLTPDEVYACLPELNRPGLQVGNYFTDCSADPERLTWMMIDQATSPNVLVRKAEKTVQKAYKFSSLRQLIHANQFAIVILVPNERKKWLVERILAKRFFAQVHVSVHVVPEIQGLLLS